MPIVAADLVLKGSTTTGSAGNTVANGGADTNLGKYCTTGVLTSASLHAVFTEVSDVDNAASIVEYQCVFLHNNHATLSYDTVVVYMSGSVAGGTEFAFAVDSTAASAVGGAGAQALTIANKTTAPAALSFTAPTTEGTGLSLGNIAAGFVKAIWVRRTAANSAALANDGATWTFHGVTAA